MSSNKNEKLSGSLVGLLVTIGIVLYAICMYICIGDISIYSFIVYIKNSIIDINILNIFLTIAFLKLIIRILCIKDLGTKTEWLYLYKFLFIALVILIGVYAVYAIVTDIVRFDSITNAILRFVDQSITVMMLISYTVKMLYNYLVLRYNKEEENWNETNIETF